MKEIIAANSTTSLWIIFIIIVISLQFFQLRKCLRGLELQDIIRFRKHD